MSQRALELPRLPFTTALGLALREGERRFLGDLRPGPVAKVVLDHPTKDVHYDYLVPKELSSLVAVGSLVWVPSRNRSSRGWVVGFGNEVGPRLKEIRSIAAPYPLLSLAQVRLAAAAAEYYLTDIRRFLRRMTPASLPRSGDPTSQVATKELLDSPSQLGADDESPRFAEALSRLVDDLKRQGYELQRTAKPSTAEFCWNQVVLVKHPPGNPPVGAVVELLEGLRVCGLSSIVALGSAATKDARRVLESIGTDCVFLDTHAPARAWVAQWARAGRPGSIVAGDRAVVLQRTGPLGAVCVIDEASPNHAEDRTPYYNARTVALLRAGVESCPVVLAGSWPTYDARASATVEAAPSGDARRNLLPRFAVVDRSKEVPEPGHISPTAARAVRRVVEGGGRAVLFVTKKGGYHSLRCRDCWFVLDRESDGHCPRCGSGRLRPTGPGTTAIEAEARRLFPGFTVSQVVKDGPPSDPKASVVVATEAALWRLDRAELVVVVSFEALVGLVSFDAWYRSARILYDLCGLLASEVGEGDRRGEAANEKATATMVIQTYHPNHPVLEALLRGDEVSLLELDLAAREAEWLPPYSRAVLLEASDEEGKALLDGFVEEISALDPTGSRLQIAGPHDDGKQRRALVLHDGGVSLWESVTALSRSAEAKGARVRVEVDPDGSYRQL